VIQQLLQETSPTNCEGAGRYIDRGFLRTVCWGRYLDTKRRRTDRG